MLPSALLDLTLLRLNTSTSSVKLFYRAAYAVRCIANVRQMHQATSVAPTASQFTYDFDHIPKLELSNSQPRSFHANGGGNNLVSQTGRKVPTAYTELERRVNALGEAASTEMSALDPPSYSEEELISFYQDILAFPSELDQDSKSFDLGLESKDTGGDLAVVSNAEQRLLALDMEKTPPVYLLEKEVAEHDQVEVLPMAYKRVLSRAHDAISRLEAAQVKLKLSPTIKSLELQSNGVSPPSIISLAEFKSISRISIQVNDEEAAYLTLDLMKRSGLVIPEEMITGTMEMYADSGNTLSMEQVIVNYLNSPPTETQRYLHIKSHLNSTPTKQIPTSALEVLHSYESQGLPAPIHSYTSVITCLFSTKSSLGRAHAWDLFTHMRYVAHSDPDLILYTLMIRACASPYNARPSEPEKALDLWTEMTVDRRLSPTAGSYDAIILACARSGDKLYINEAFRLAKQMFDAHRDAGGVSMFLPSRRTFCALLEGAKRIGDLARARWILAQMVIQQNEGEGVNEEVMVHIFHAYASYRVPFKRNAVLSVGKAALTSSSSSDSNNSPITEASTIHKPSQIADIGIRDEAASFSNLPPQTSAEVIQEVQLLFNQVLDDRNIKLISSQSDDKILPFQQKFKDVELTSRLLNSYLSVHYRHASLHEAHSLYKRIFDECSVHCTGRTYVEALERCSTARSHERAVAVEFAQQVWVQWQILEQSGQDGNRSLSGRTIERAHIAMIRLLSLTHNTDQALQHLRTFASRYPPSEILTPTPKLASRSTRTTLTGERPLVRMTSTTEVPDDHVPPLIMFKDVEVLHHRLVAQGAKKEIAYLTYLCKAYEGSLRARRNAALRAKLVPSESRSDSHAVRLALPSS